MYLWIVIVGGMFAFFASMGIGANDVANAFATSVGAKTLTLKQAVVLAAIFETSGAILMGGHVTNTIRKGIADYQCFEDNPYVLMYGCMWVILSVGLWLFLASYYEMPVSTTHSCVGGMIGMALVLGGKDCVIWYKETDTFPYVGGVSGIVTSWFISPVFSGIISYIVFGLTRCLVLRHDFKTNRINILYPVLIGSTVTINTFFIIYKGAKGLGLDKTPIGIALGTAFGAGGVCAIITIPIVPKIKRYIENKFENNGPENNNAIEMVEVDNMVENRIVKMHNSAETFDIKHEELFKYLQVFTAICDSFSHGANDVANAIGPFATIYAIYHSNGVLSDKNSMEEDAYWILGLGGTGIAVGLLVYGHKITKALGEKLCKITPSRGVAIELGSALIIITGSRLKLPLSTTHCQVGSTVGVGLLEDHKKCSGINCKLLLKTAFGWVITCVIVGLTSGMLAAQGAYGPTLNKYESCNLNITR